MFLAMQYKKKIYYGYWQIDNELTKSVYQKSIYQPTPPRICKPNQLVNVTSYVIQNVANRCQHGRTVGRRNDRKRRQAFRCAHHLPFTFWPAGIHPDGTAPPTHAPQTAFCFRNFVPPQHGCPQAGTSAGTRRNTALGGCRRRAHPGTRHLPLDW